MLACQYISILYQNYYIWFLFCASTIHWRYNWLTYSTIDFEHCFRSICGLLWPSWLPFADLRTGDTIYPELLFFPEYLVWLGKPKPATYFRFDLNLRSLWYPCFFKWWNNFSTVIWVFEIGIEKSIIGLFKPSIFPL